MNAILPQGERPVHSAAFPKHHRLTRTDDFSSVFSFRKALKSKTGRFLLHYRPRAREQGEVARLGLVIAKRLLRRSVDRNLLRRLIREAFRKQHTELPSCDLIVRLAVKPALPLDRCTLSEEIQTLFERMRNIGL